MKYTDLYWQDVDQVIDVIPNISKLFGKKVLLTGATGMICSCVAEILFRLNKKGASIAITLAGRDSGHISERFCGFTEGKDYRFLSYDATKSMSLAAEPDFIIHGAGNANPAIYTKEPVETMLGNIVGLNTLLSLALEKKCCKLLYISSSEIYGRQEENRAYKESDYGYIDILNPRACYPNAKRAAETLCASYGAQHGVKTVIVRPGHIYGPTITRSDTRASAQFTWNVIDGQDILMKSAGVQMRSYCYTLDCASAILTVLINGISGEAYNISNKDSVVSIRTMAEYLAAYAGVKIVFDNPSDAETKGYNLMPNSSLDAEKLELLGWKARFNLEEGIKRTIDYLR